MPHLAVGALEVARENHPNLRRGIAANAGAIRVRDEWVGRGARGACGGRGRRARCGCRGRCRTRGRWCFRARVLSALACGARDEQNGGDGDAEIEVHRTMYRDGVGRARNLWLSFVSRSCVAERYRTGDLRGYVVGLVRLL